MSKWHVYDRVGGNDIHVGSVTASSYDEALQLATEYYPGAVAWLLNTHETTA